VPHVVSVHAKAEIEAFARKNPFLHIFEIGDLDDFFWPYTIWYGWQEQGEIQQLALIYTAFETPALLAFADPPHEQMPNLLKALLPLLPRRIFAQVDPNSIDIFADSYHIESQGLLWKMALVDVVNMASVDTSAVIQFSDSDLEALEEFYSDAYPTNVFSARMLQTGRYYGIRQDKAIISAAGVHVYSPAYRVAALGNVSTQPEFRGRGLAAQVCAKLCQVLYAEGINQIGLNVKADNPTAIALYQRLGFEKVAEFGMYALEMR
jgi:RimJ/RimL family protein N-acetyltransferase